jgi:hypothetical protein
MRHFRRVLPALVIATTISTIASAQTTRASSAPDATVAPATKPFVFGMTANAMSINSAVATQQMVKPTSFGMQIDLGVTFARFLFAGIDLGPQMLRDQGSFTQTTTAGDMNSSADLLYYSAMAGVRSPSVRMLPFIPATSFGLYGGGSGTKGKRSIDKCVDCYSEDITIAGGSFVQPTLVFGEGKARMRVSDRYFTGGKGIRSVYSLGLELGGR